MSRKQKTMPINNSKVNAYLKHRPATPPPPKTNKNSLSDTIKGGFSFGLGSSIAHKVTDFLFFEKKDDKNETNIEKNNSKTFEKNKNNDDDLFRIYMDCIEKAKTSEDSLKCNKILDNNN